MKYTLACMFTNNVAIRMESLVNLLLYILQHHIHRFARINKQHIISPDFSPNQRQRYK